VALTAGATYFSTVYGIAPVLWFFFGVLKVIFLGAIIIGTAMILGVIGCIIASATIWLYEAARDWIYE
jgi:hypothetical protein